MSIEQRGQKDVLPFLKGAFVVLMLCIGGELVTSFAHPAIHLLTLASTSTTVFDAAIYFFGVSTDKNNS